MPEFIVIRLQREGKGSRPRASRLVAAGRNPGGDAPRDRAPARAPPGRQRSRVPTWGAAHLSDGTAEVAATVTCLRAMFTCSTGTASLRTTASVLIADRYRLWAAEMLRW